MDLYQDSPDLFIAGLAQGNARLAVVRYILHQQCTVQHFLFSFHRYDPALTFSPELWWERSVRRVSGTARLRAIQVLHSVYLV